MFDLNMLKELYKRNENLMEYMRNQSGTWENSAEQIMLSYDFQAGTYMASYYRDPSSRLGEAGILAEIMEEKNLSGTLLEAGVGEASTLVPLLNILRENGNLRFDSVYGFDISWSRIKAAKKFAKDQNQEEIHFFTGDLLNIPLLDNSVDTIYTCDAIEPNGGKEKEILQELYRVCKQYLILREPCFEFAGEKARTRMKKHGYITNLYESAKTLGYNIERYGLYHSSPEDLNPEGLMIVKKEQIMDNAKDFDSPFACPISKKPMNGYGVPEWREFYCPESMLAYPVIQGIPCLLPNNAIVATKYFEKF